MRIVHLSDLHLGHRAFSRIERGGNLRERDLAAIFHQAVLEIGRLAPDVVLIGGDLFDHPDPPSTAFLALTRGIRRLQELLPDVPVFAIAGECDTPAAPGDPGPVAVLDVVPGVEAAAGAPRAVHVRRLGLHVLLVPHRAVVRPPFPELRPDPDARWNVLLVRGHPMKPELARGAASTSGQGPGVGAPEPFRLDPEGWDYVAVGGPHRAIGWGRHVRSSGSLERVGLDPWREAGEEKGFLLLDLAEGTSTFHPVAARPVVDLAPVRVDGGESKPGTRRLRELLEGFPGGIEGKILRVRLRGDVTAPTEGVSPGLLAGLRRRTAHLEVRIEGPEVLDRQGGAEAGARIRRPPPGEPPRLTWMTGRGRRGEVRLTRGLWTVTATSADDLERLADHLVRELDRGGDAPFQDADEEARLRIRLEGVEVGAPSAVGLFRSAGETAAGPPRSSGGAPPAAEEPVDPGTRTPSPTAELHAEWIEAEGDAEVRALDWARERQDADSRLVLYRERALELKERIRTLREEGPEARCPTCRRALGDAFAGLLAVLEEEWEDVVQDGTWWKRRRSQLDEKPPELLSLERRALELRARLEEGLATPGAPAGAVPAAPNGAREAVPRVVLRRAGNLLRKASDGLLDGVAEGPDGGLLVVEATGRVRVAARGEEGLLALVMQAATAAMGAGPEDGSSTRVHLLTEGRAGVPRAALVRLLDELVSSEAPASWVAVVPPGVSEALPHRLQGTIELLRDEEHRPRIRVAPPGRARLELAPFSGAGEGPHPTGTPSR